jgi:hypothetical protein
MSSDPGCKIDDVTERYDLESVDPIYDSIDEGLLVRWTGGGKRTAMGYRSLTEWFNKRLLKAIYDDHGRETLAARLDSDYEVLTGDADLIGEELFESLRADGIDSDRLERDLVSWGTMRTHLKECLGGHKEPQTASTDWEQESIEKAIEVAEQKTESALSALSNKGTLAGGSAAGIDVQIRLSCQSCPTRVPFDIALQRGYICENHDTQRLSQN